MNTSDEGPIESLEVKGDELEIETRAKPFSRESAWDYRCGYVPLSVLAQIMRDRGWKVEEPCK